MINAKSPGLPLSTDVDIPALKKKYQQERDRRMRKEGQTQYVQPVDDFADAYGPQTRHTKQKFSGCPVDIEREDVSTLQCPCKFWINIKVQHALVCPQHNFVLVKSVKSEQPVGLIQTMLA